MEKLVECVPNFSEGRDMAVIGRIADAIRNAGTAADKVKILDIDSGNAANRTVITFAGSPEAVIEAAFQAVRIAGDLIDMRAQHGAHPRMGATDVLPIVPVSGISLEECATLARNLAKRIYEDLGIPCYCYEASASRPERKRLEVCRAGEYESLPSKMSDPLARPDFGPAHFTAKAAKSGASIVGARNYLIAVNFNLNTSDKEKAMEIAKDVRESGRIVTNGNVKARIPGTLPGVKAIGWYIDEYGFAQVSMNITDITSVPLHKAFEEVEKSAKAHGFLVTGTEIIGLVPLKVLTDAGRHFSEKTLDGNPTDFVETAIRRMNLDQIRPFVPQKRIIEYLM